MRVNPGKKNTDKIRLNRIDKGHQSLDRFRFQISAVRLVLKSTRTTSRLRLQIHLFVQMGSLIVSHPLKKAVFIERLCFGAG